MHLLKLVLESLQWKSLIFMFENKGRIKINFWHNNFATNAVNLALLILKPEYSLCGTLSLEQWLRHETKAWKYTILSKTTQKQKNTSSNANSVQQNVSLTKIKMTFYFTK